MAGRPRANSKAAAGVLLDIDNLLSPKSSASDWSTGPLSVDILFNETLRNGRRPSAGLVQLKPNGRNKVRGRDSVDKVCWKTAQSMRYCNFYNQTAKKPRKDQFLGVNDHRPATALDKVKV